MKPNIVIITLLGFVAAAGTAFAQDNSSTNAGVVPPATVVVTNEATPSATNTVVAATAAPAAPSTEAAPPGGDASAPSQSAQTPATTSGSAAQPGVIPLIVMDDVALTDAIQNLARQANLNYLLDPTINLGQPGPGGTPVQPHVSIRWENVSAQQALLALLNNYNLQLVEDPKTGIARITTKDPAAPPALVTKIIQLKFASPSNTVAAVQSLLLDKRSKVMPDNRTSQLIVVSTENEMNDVEKMIARLDMPTKQVLIEARLLEVSYNPSTSKGLDWSGTFQNQHLSVGNNLNGGPLAGESNPTLSGSGTGAATGSSFPKMLFDTAKGFNPATAFLDADGVSAVFSFLNACATVKTLSTPRAVTLDNETAFLAVTRATPIINVTAGTANTTGGSQIAYTNLGVILNVTPRISANNYINLKVVPEVSRVFDTVTKIISGQVFQADEYDVRKVNTQVMIPSGHTLVLGGLVQDDLSTSSTKVPLLGDIPGLGAAFRSTSKQLQKGNLLIFITPTIVQDEDFQATPSAERFLKTPVQTTEDAMKSTEWSSWDTTTPMDWSKLGKKSSQPSNDSGQ
jgi:type II secretory pathway component GspD/PulD (secretin)